MTRQGRGVRHLRMMLSPTWAFHFSLSFGPIAGVGSPVTESDGRLPFVIEKARRPVPPFRAQGTGTAEHPDAALPLVAHPRCDHPIGDRLAAAIEAVHVCAVAKLARNGSSGRFTIASKGNGKRTTIRDDQSGIMLPLKGYGALKGEYAARHGIDLSKPIAAQTGNALSADPGAPIAKDTASSRTA